jgi:hypothetical protein
VVKLAQPSIMFPRSQSKRRSQKPKAKRNLKNTNHKALDEISNSLRLQQPGPLATRKDPRYRQIRQGVFTCQRSAAYSVVSTGAIANTIYGALQFSLGSFAGYAELTALFDSWRIQQIRIEFMPYTLRYIPGTSALPGLLHTVTDFDDATPPTSVDSLREYSSYQLARYPAYVERVINPCAALAAYQGAFTAYARIQSPWIDATDYGVLHYGLKYALEVETAGTSIPAYNIQITAIIQCKDVR